MVEITEREREKERREEAVQFFCPSLIKVLLLSAGFSGSAPPCLARSTAPPFISECQPGLPDWCGIFPA